MPLSDEQRREAVALLADLLLAAGAKRRGIGSGGATGNRDPESMPALTRTRRIGAEHVFELHGI